MRTVEELETIMRSIVQTYNNNDAMKAVRVMCLMIMEAINIEEMTTGVLRFSDLTRMTMTDDGVHNYLNPETRQITCRKWSTKNKKEREMRVSQRFVDGIYEIYGGCAPERVLVTDEGLPWTNTCRGHT